MPSQLKVNTLESNEPIGTAVSFPKGLVVSSGYALTSTSLNITGVVTATDLSGSGTGLTGLSVVQTGVALGVFFTLA